jgi:hypothetical protein
MDQNTTAASEAKGQDKKDDAPVVLHFSNGVHCINQSNGVQYLDADADAAEKRALRK